MEYSTIQFRKAKEGIGVITLNRPEKRNAINIQMRIEISDCLYELEQSSDINVVIFTGAGSSFSAGFDLDEFNNPAIFDALFETSSKYHRDIWNFSKPTIAAINGAAMGGGFDLATLCDIRICSDSATFGHPEVKFGAPPLYTPLRWIINDGIARELCLTGRRIDAKEALRIGLVSEITNSSDLLKRAIEIGDAVLEAPSDTIKYIKSYFISNTEKGFEESFLVEHDKAFQDVLLPKAKNGIPMPNGRR